MIDYALILEKAHSGAQWVITDNRPDTLVWLSDGDKPTVKELTDSWPIVQSQVWSETMRDERDRLLSASDWAMTSDAPTDKQAWADYRQALRDFPATWTPGPVADFPDPPA